MCATCGCSDEAKPRIIDMQTGASAAVDDREGGAGHEHVHSHTHTHIHSHNDSAQLEHEHSHPHTHPHAHDHGHDHDHEHGDAHAGSHRSIVNLEMEILGKNDRLAAVNRKRFKELNVTALNLVSAPGAGKTALLERTIRDLKSEFTISVIEGDQATVNDAERILRTGTKVVQINTGAGCHLDAQMVSAGVRQLDPPEGSIVFIENVGNLVCPALFDLGEQGKVAILSITEGEDKPVKYPHMFREAEILLLNKMDLLPHLEFDLESCKRFALSINPRIKIFEVSAATGIGLPQWYDWIRGQLKARETF